MTNREHNRQLVEMLLERAGDSPIAYVRAVLEEQEDTLYAGTDNSGQWYVQSDMDQWRDLCEFYDDDDCL